MNWSKVGEWLKSNAGSGAALVGSLLTGNVPGAVAAGVALVSSATGSADPEQALSTLQHDPATVLKLRELALQEQDAIRKHIEAMESLRLADEQAAHAEQQETIRTGDTADDTYVRHTRPMMARQSWYATAGYIGVFELLRVAGYGDGPNFELAALAVSPAAAYLGFRTLDKWKAKK